MYVRHVAPELLATTDHPAWARFSTGLTDSESVLLVPAPAGLGRGWFARSWSGDRDVVIVHVRDGAHPLHPGDRITANSLAEALDTPAAQALTGPVSQRRLAIVLDSPTFDWSVLAGFDWRLVRVPDLLLSVDEIAALAEHNASAPLLPEDIHDPLTASEELHRLTGGWLEPTLILLRDPSALAQAQESMLPFLSHWIVGQHNGWEMAKSAFLEPITPATLSTFFREVHGEPPLVEDLLAAGFLVRDGDGLPFMPSLVRHCLKTLVRQNDRGLADDLVAVAIEAVAESADLVSAVHQAAAHGHWRALGAVLLERGMELFTADARIIRRLLALMPATFVDQWLGDFGGAAVRIIKGARTDGMSFILPDGGLEYERDSLASRMLTSTTRLYRSPGPQALAFGLIEVGYLRIAGHDIQAAAAARRLITALHTAESRSQLRPALASVVNLHAGVALEIGGDKVRAYSSYRAAFYHVDGTDHPFLLADTTSKLALITALHGDTHEAREWIAEHERWVGKVGWGRPMVARNAQLARVLVALTDLNLDAVDDALSVLPAAPDQNETWQVHAYLLAMRSLLAGQPRKALVVTNSMRYQRPHPSKTPLAQCLFAIADHAAYAASPFESPSPGPGAVPPPTPEILLLEAYHAVVAGDLERASLRLTRARADVMGARWLNIAAQLHIITNDRASGDLVEHLIDDIVSGQGALVDIVLLRRHGILSESHIRRLPDEARARITRIPEVRGDAGMRPALTPREREVLDGLREGLTRRQIAQQQFRSENTVRSQVRSLYQKLGAGSSEEALETARRWGL